MVLADVPVSLYQKPERGYIRMFPCTQKPERGYIWEVLDGVGVDGIGGNFPFFLFFVGFLRFSSFFFAFLLILPAQEQTSAIYWKNGEFHSNPVCTDPVENFPIHVEHPLYQNRNKGIFAKTALLRNRPFASSRTKTRWP